MPKYIFLKKKNILGKTIKIYTKKESRKEYVKYKNRMINIAKYKKIKNNKGKKMKGGGPKAPSLIRRRTRDPSQQMIRRTRHPSLIRRTKGHSLIEKTRGPSLLARLPYALEERRSRAMKRNMLDLTDTMRGLGFLEQQQRDSRIRFGSDQVHLIPSRKELLDQNENPDTRGPIDKSKLSSFSRRSTSREPSRSILKKRNPSYKRPSLLHSRRPPSRRSVLPTLQE